MKIIDKKRVIKEIIGFSLLTIVLAIFIKINYF